MELYFVLLAAAIVLCLLFLSSHARGLGRFVYLASKIDGPSLWQLLTIHAKPLLYDDAAAYIAKLCESNGYKPWGIWLTNGFLINVSDCDTVHEIFKSKNTMDKADIFYKDCARFLGNGLFTMSGSQYRPHRKIVAVGFRKSLQKAYVPRLDQYMPKLVEDLRKKADGGKSFDPRYIVDLHTMILTVLFATRAASDNAVQSMICALPWVGRVLEVVQWKGFNPVYFWLVHRLKKSTREVTERTNELADVLRREVMPVEKERALGTDQDDDTLDFAQVLFGEFLKSAEYDGNDEQLFDHTRTLIITGFETTSYALNILLLLLALEQDVQQRVLNEMKLVLGENERPIEVDDLDRMDYTERVIKEALRLFPPAGIIGRNVSEETQFNKLLAPRGSMISINLVAIHRNPENFPDPLKFDPDRFLPEVSKERHPCAYIPFSFGLRSCPGQFSTVVTMKLVLCHVVRNFKILPGDNLKTLNDIKVKMRVTMHLVESSVRLVDRSSGKV